MREMHLRRAFYDKNKWHSSVDRYVVSYDDVMNILLWLYSDVTNIVIIFEAKLGNSYYYRYANFDSLVR